MKGAFCFCIRLLNCGRGPHHQRCNLIPLARLIDCLLEDVQQQQLCACILMMLCAQQPQPLRLLCPPSSSYLAIALVDRLSCWCWCKSPHCHYPPDLLLPPSCCSCLLPRYVNVHTLKLILAVWLAMLRRQLPYLSALWLQPFGRQPVDFMLKHTFQFSAGLAVLFSARDQKLKRHSALHPI